MQGGFYIGLGFNRGRLFKEILAPDMEAWPLTTRNSEPASPFLEVGNGPLVVSKHRETHRETINGRTGGNGETPRARALRVD